MGSSHSHQRQMNHDMGSGFRHFIDDVMRGRENKTILNGSIGVSLLDTGLPAKDGFPEAFSIPEMLHNNEDLLGYSSLTDADAPVNIWQAIGSGDHALFDFTPDNFTFFGLDFPDMWNELKAGTGFLDESKINALEEAGELGSHHTPLYTDAEGNASTIASALNLPDLPYGGLAHFAHMGMAVYDTGRTFQDLWNEPALKHNVFKIMTHPEMSETLLHRGVMLSVMGMLHPLGGVIAIGVGYLCAHLVHTAFKFLNNHKDVVQEVMQLPVLKTIYDATGIKEWAEAKDKQSSAAEQLDPLEEPVTSAQFSNGAREKYVPVNHIETLNSERVGAVETIPLRSVS